MEAEKATRTHVWKPLPAGQSYVAGNDRSVEGRTLTTGGVRFGKGIGTTPADKSFEIGACTRFDATAGVDDEVDGRVDRAAGVGGSVTVACCTRARCGDPSIPRCRSAWTSPG